MAMKVTKTTFGMLARNRHEANKKTVKLQGMCKSGKWGKTFEAEYYGGEKTPQDVANRFTRNNNKEFRVVEE